VQLASTPAEMAAIAEGARRAGQIIAFVPTMGALHAGHSSLLEEARRRGQLAVLSIFVNPLQFGPREDLAAYPRTPEEDEARARDAGVDVLYRPSVDAMYPPGFQTQVTVTELEQPMCGEARPGHFKGVATVVLKLFGAVRPHIAIFGQKDFQQLQIIRRLVRDLDLGIEIVGMPIVREADGLAMSSRNVYLSADERQAALGLSRGLRAVAARYEGGERSGSQLLGAARDVLAPLLEAGAIGVEYLDLRDAESLQPLTEVSGRALVAVAARVGKTRLIDNVVLG
jgi:pantoate--beta-alanine ligase